MTSQQEVDDKPPPMGYPASGIYQQPMSPINSGHGLPYNQYAEHHPHHSVGYPPGSPHLHLYFLSAHSMEDQESTSSPAYYIASQLAHPDQDKKKLFSFTKIMICLLAGLIISTSLMSLLVWALAGSHPPVFEVQAFSVPLFDINNTALHASWVAKISVINPNRKLNLSFGYIESQLVYKEFLIDSSISEPVKNVNAGSQGTIIVNFAVPSQAYDSDKAFCMKSMNEDYGKGIILFSVRFVMEAKMSSGDVWRRKYTLKVFCEDLEVLFEGGEIRRWNSKKSDCYLAV